jgi:hypothetical protein
MINSKARDEIKIYHARCQNDQDVRRLCAYLRSSFIHSLSHTKGEACSYIKSKAKNKKKQNFNTTMCVYHLY